WVSNRESVERRPRTMPVSLVVDTASPPVVADTETSVNGSFRPLSSYLGTSPPAIVGAAGTRGEPGWLACPGRVVCSARVAATGAGAEGAAIGLGSGAVGGGAGGGGGPRQAESATQIPPSVPSAIGSFTSWPPWRAPPPPAWEPPEHRVSAPAARHDTCRWRG